MSIAQVYDLLVGAIQPRPIAFVSTLSKEGHPNLAPFSFFMAGGANPPSLIISPVLDKDGQIKGTARNCKDTGEFVVNTVTRQMAEGMNQTSFNFPHGFDEWRVAGFTDIDCDLVKPKRVEESPVAMECKVFDIVQHGEGPSAACYVIGEVVRFHIAEEIWNGQWISPEKYRPISRMGGPNYLDTESLELFTMLRPTGEPDPDSETKS